MAQVNEWLTVPEAAQHARCGKRSIYSAVQHGKLRAAKLGGRRELRFLAGWIDEWLLKSSTPEFINPSTPADDVVGDRVKSAAQ